VCVQLQHAAANTGGLCEGAAGHAAALAADAAERAACAGCDCLAPSPAGAHIAFFLSEEAVKLLVLWKSLRCSLCLSVLHSTFTCVGPTSPLSAGFTSTLTCVSFWPYESMC